MLARIWPAELVGLVADERKLLADVQTALTMQGADEPALDALAASVRQLDELFMVVVVGEFNAGKSALINSLLGQPFLDEGVTPTTSVITVVQFDTTEHVETSSETIRRIFAPVSLLQDVTIVDTPGTNALDRRHEALTAEFLPRSDMVLFVTSADRPFSESERVFLEAIREWGKKVSIVINKLDILAGEEAIDEVRRYVADNARQLLGVEPEIFLISAKAAASAHGAGDLAALDESGLPSLEAHLRETLDDIQQLRLKLMNPLGVAGRLVADRLDVVENRLDLLKDDLTTIDDIQQQLEAYAKDVDREFGLRLSDMDNSLHRLEKRGLEFFDDTVRLTRFSELLRKDHLRDRFEREVVANAPQEIEKKVESLIDWLVESDVGQWQAVVQHVNRRRSQHEERIVGEIGGRFEVDRQNLLERVGQAARKGLASYDRSTEARRMAEGVQNAVAGTALVEVGAVGLGATVVYIASGTAFDATGIAAAGVLAALGFFILPARRRRAKSELKEKIATMRKQLMEVVSTQFETEAKGSRARIRETVAPYTRFVRSEQDQLTNQRETLRELVDRVAQTKEAASAIGQ